MSDLIQAIHGSKDGIDRIILAFHETHSHVPKAQIKKKIGEISEKVKSPEGTGTPRFIVKPEFLKEVSLEVSLL